MASLPKTLPSILYLLVFADFTCTVKNNEISLKKNTVEGK